VCRGRRSREPSGRPGPGRKGLGAHAGEVIFACRLRRPRGVGWSSPGVALTDARARGVAVSIVVETLQGAGGAPTGAEPAAAFRNIPGIELWHWPPRARAEPGAKMHAKIAVADRRALLVSSANLTQSGVATNIEAGVLVRGGHAPSRAAEHGTHASVTSRATGRPLGRAASAKCLRWLRALEQD
jgi:phosphatidylserine/phosphatidylglycerophosphate/cardiolipin synthase-like enzyme